MSSKDVFYEILSKSSNTVISDAEFVVSPPIVVDAAKTQVTILPQGQTPYYGSARVVYTRLTLDEMPVLWVNAPGVTTYHELVEVISDRKIFKYVLPNGYVRMLFLTKEDVVDGPLVFPFSQDPGMVEITANPDSYLFIGKLKVQL